MAIAIRGNLDTTSPGGYFGDADLPDDTNHGANWDDVEEQIITITPSEVHRLAGWLALPDFADEARDGLSEYLLAPEDGQEWDALPEGQRDAWADFTEALKTLLCTYINDKKFG